MSGAASAGVSADPAARCSSGVVTFLFTDVEGSTRRWEADAEGMRAALAAHDEVLRTAIEAHGGWLFKHTGDGVCAAFASPRSAVDAAVAAQRSWCCRCGWALRPAKPNCATGITSAPCSTALRIGDGRRDNGALIAPILRNTTTNDESWILVSHERTHLRTRPKPRDRFREATSDICAAVDNSATNDVKSIASPGR